MSDQVITLDDLMGINHTTIDDSLWKDVKQANKVIAERRTRQYLLKTGNVGELIKQNNARFTHECPYCGQRKSSKEALELHYKWAHEEHEQSKQRKKTRNRRGKN